VRDAANNVIGRYFYDGDGRRVKKIVPATGETTIFVYDASGRLVTEYSTIVANSTDAKVAYLTNDHLGTPRIKTDANGNVTARHDYHPFGEEIGTLAVVPGSPQPRTAALGYQSDSVRQKFTGYERDTETDLDFAQARYYGSSHGRFTSVDPYNIIFEKEKGKNEKEKLQIFLIYISQPQIWNKYSYSVNNPLKFTDPDGRRPITEQEKKNIEKFIQSGIDYANNEISDPKQREAFIQQVRNAAKVIEDAILAVPTGKEDPKNLGAALYAIGKIGSPGFTQAESNYFRSNGVTVTFGGAYNGWFTSSSGTNKCNFFVAVAYAKGANIGWQTASNLLGFQVNQTLSGNFYPPTANNLVTGGANNFVSVASPGLGDIVSAHGVNGNAGHTGIVISGTVVVSANPTHGVRTGQFPSSNDVNTGVNYLRYKP